MLIDDRQIHSVDVSKIIDLARVGLTNDYNDLDNIPETFPPSEHTHPNATETNNGYMSKEDYIKLKNIKEFKYLNIIASNETTKIEAEGYEDTLTLKAGKNIVFSYDEATKILSFAVDYSVEEADLKGEKGDKGDTGPRGNAWRPIVDIDGNLTFEINNTEVPPNLVNIKGKEGKQGDKGEDAPTPIWRNLEGKPSGNIGDTLFIKENNTSNYEVGPLLVEGMFPNSESELNEYKKLSYNFETIRDNWNRKYNTTDSNDESEEIINKYWDISESGISFLKKVKGFSHIDDWKIYDDYSISVNFENMLLTGAVALVISSRNNNGSLSTLSFVRIFDRNALDLFPYETIFYNYAIVFDLGLATQRVIKKLSITETLDLKNKVKFKLRATRTGNKIKVEWTPYSLQTQAYQDYVTDNYLEIDLGNDSSLVDMFMGSGGVGIGSVNQIFNNAIFFTKNDISNTIYPIYNNEVTKSFRCLPDTKIWTEDNNKNIRTDIGVGRYIKDINSQKLYFVESDRIVYIKGAGPGEKLYVVNYTMDTPITEELVK